MRYWMSGLWIIWVVTVYAQHDTEYTLKRDWLTGQREALPVWLTAVQEKGWVTGISDPGLKPEVAREQALMRATFLYALSEGVKVSVVTDYFNFSHKRYEYEFTDDKLISLIRMETVLPVMDWQVEQEWETQYGEIILRVSPRSVRKDGRGGEASGDLMLVSRGDLWERNELRCEWKFWLDCPGKLCTCGYQIKGNEGNLQIRTQINDTVLVIPGEGYWYADQGEPSGSSGYGMNSSCWCAQMQSLLYALANHNYREVKLKNLEEGRQESGCGLKREVVQGRVSVTLQIVGIKDNQLFVNWQIENI